MALLREITAYLSDPGTWEGGRALHRLVGQHVYYSTVSTLIALAIAVPLGLWIGHRGRGELVVVNATNVGRAVPDFGIIILAFIVFGLSDIPVFVTLAALAVPPILINTYVGIRQVDADLRDAAEGVGMTGWQVLTRVEIPVAAPLLMTGIRTASVQVVATATLAGYIGLGGLGRPIFDGIAVGFNAARARIIVASILVGVLAVLTEVGLGAIERRLSPAGVGAPQKGTTMRRPGPRRRLLAVLAALAVLTAACGNGDGPQGEDEPRESVTIGSADFDENEIVASMYSAVLSDAGYDVEERFLLGTREIYFPALEDGEIDLVPEYAGTAVEFLNEGAGEATGDTEETVERLRELLAERDLEALEPAEAENANGLVVTRETAEEHDLETVSDLEPVAGELVLGGPPECPERPLCLPGYEETYGLDFADFQPLDASGPLTVSALAGGDIDVALLFTTDHSIVENDWVLLSDDKGLQPAENLIPVIRSEVLDERIAEALNGVSAELTTEELTALNGRVRTEGADPADVAEEWLAEKGLLGS